MISKLLRSRAALVLALLGDFVLFGGPHRPDTNLRRSFDAALAAQVQATASLIDRPGVVGTAVGIGPSGRAVVMVYLESPGTNFLPAQIAGVPVVGEVTGPFEVLTDPPLEADPKQSFPRPVPIGVSTGHPGVTAGTIGARVTDGFQVYALSNNHVFANNNSANRGDPMLQPGVADGGRSPEDGLATLHDWEPIEFCATFFSCPLNQMDAAIALTHTDSLGVATPEGGYGAPRSTPIDARLSMKVQKFGRTTGYTEGTITGLNATIDVNYRTGSARFDGQIVVTGNGFSAGGDSGSLIVSKGALMADRRPVALLFAGSPTSTIANPIGPVLDRFGVSIDGG